MERVSHREMRNRSGEILRRVEAGESFEISNNGQPAAMLVPIGGSAIDALVARGEARPARSSAQELFGIVRSTSPMTSRELIDDSRGQW